jgi:tRNA nucleotidyltransferase (CCA-adding enzyme)
VRAARPHLRGAVSAVGGVVRDAALGLPPGDDLDLVVEGDAVALGAELALALGAPWVPHPRFGTAELTLPHGGRIDLAGARRERYAAPGALPEVAPGALADDLARRDFSANAMALRLTGDEEGALVDPHGGLPDLEQGLLRALRGDAFSEDPSRVVRAARYAARLGLGPDPGTEAALRAAAPALDPGSARVADELRRLLEERAGPAALGLLAGWGVPWAAPGGAGPRLAALDAALARPGAPDLPAWAVRLGVAVVPARLADVALPGWAVGVARGVAEGPGLAARLRAAGRLSEVDRILAREPEGAQVGALAAGADAVAAWWDGARERAPEVRGADLVAAGVPPGPAIGRGLGAAREALLDGDAPTREEQLRVALRAARGAPG